MSTYFNFITLTCDNNYIAVFAQILLGVLEAYIDPVRRPFSSECSLEISSEHSSEYSLEISSEYPLEYSLELSLELSRENGPPELS